MGQYDLFRKIARSNIPENDRYVDELKNDILSDFQGSLSFEKVTINDVVRNVQIINKTKLNEKTMLSQPNETFSVGDIFSWNDSFWLITEIDLNDTYNTKATIRQCNNQIKWINANGVVISFHCAIEDNATDTEPDFNSNIILSDGTIKVNVPRNEYISTIQENDRFLFNKKAFKTSFVNDLVSNKCPVIILKKDNISPDDDIVNNIANVNKYQYSLTIDQSDFEGQIGDIGTLSATLKLNNEIVSRDLAWTSSNENIATIDEDGNYELVSDGEVVFTCEMADNPNISDECEVVVKTIPVSVPDIIIEPSVIELFQGDVQTYTVKKLINNVDTGEILIIQNMSNIPVGYYEITIGVNTFTVKNIKKYSLSNVLVKVSDGLGNEKEISIKLKGSF